MPTYRVLDQDALIGLAAQRGWIEGPAERHRTSEALPPVLICPREGWRMLPATEVVLESSVCLRIPSVTVHGGNFSLIIEDCIFPGGFAHSFAPSPAWQQAGPGTVHYTGAGTRPLGVVPSCLLGLVAHWGHFFVDALERVFQLERHGQLQSPLLVADPDFFGLSPEVDACHAVPQVSDLLRLMGIGWSPGQVIAVDKRLDHAVEDLRIHTLGALKPAIPAASFQAVQQRALDRAGAPRTPWPTGDSGELLFVGRSDVRKRFLLNQDDIVRFVVDAHGGQAVFPEHLALEETLQAFNRASRVILPIGSAKFNLLFCRPGTLVICVAPKGYSALGGGVSTMLRHLCHAVGLKLAFYDVEIVEQRMLVNSDMRMTESDIEEIMDVFDEMA